MSLFFSKLSTIFPDETEVQVAGETLKLKRFNMVQIKQAHACVGFFMELTAQTKGKELNLRDVLEVIQASAGPAILLAAVAAKKPLEWAEELGPEEIVPLLLACVKVNKDFFSKALRPKIPGWTKRVKELLKLD